MTEQTTPVTETAKKKSTQVSTTLTPEVHAKLEDYRWSNRINKVSDIVADAVDFYLDAKAKETPAKPAK